MPQDKKKFRQKNGEENLDHLRYLEKMDQINRAMQGTNDLEQVMKDVLDTLLSVFECDRAWLVYPCDPQASTWQTPMERTRPEYPGILPIGVELPLDPVGAEVYRKLRNADGPVKFGPGCEYPVPLEIAGAFKVQSFIAMAFYPKIGKAWSFGLHQCSFARVWTPQEERLFQEIGRRLSDTLTSLLAFRNLRESEAQIRQLIDASPLPMVVASGLEEHVEWVNGKFIGLFGYTIGDIPDVEHWWPLAYPDPEYREAIKSEWEEKARKAIRDKGQIEPMEAKVTCKDGSIRIVEVQFSSIGEQHLITFVDFTERKRMEEALSASETELRSLINTMTDIIFVGNSEGRFLKIVDTNPSLLYKPSKALLGKTLHEVFPKDQADFFLNHLREALATQKSVNFEYSIPIEDKKMWFYATVSPMPGDQTLMVARDITGRKQAEEALKERERHSQSLLRLSKNLERAQTYAETLNAAHVEVSSVIGYQNLWVYLLSEDKKSFKSLIAGGMISDIAMSEEGTATLTIQGDQMLEEIAEAKDIVIVEDAQTDKRTNKEIVTKLGNRTIVNVPIILFDRHLGTVGMGTFGDEGVRIPSGPEQEYLKSMASHLAVSLDRIHLFAERKRAEVEIQALAKFPSENPNPVLRITHDGVLLYANRASAGLLRCWNCSIGKALPHPWRKLILEILDSGLPMEKEMVCEDRVFALMFSPIVESNYVNIYGRDITERKQAEQELVVREREYRILLENIPDLIVRYDANLRRVYVNPAWERASGLSAAEVVNVHPADLPRVPNPINNEYHEKLQYVLTTGTAQSIEFTWVNANGTTLFLDYVITPEYDRSGKISGVLSVGRDITERKRAEEAQHRLYRELHAISNCNQTLMRAVDEQALLNDICRIICDEAGYRMAWVGYPEHDEANTVRPVAWAGVEDGYLAAANITWADTERGRGPSGTAIRSGKSACIQDFATDSQAALWREAALQRGYRSNIALPLKDENANTFGVLTIYSMEPNAFTLEERRLLEELAGDLAFGITVLRARAEHKRVEEQLQKSEVRFRSFVEKANDIIYTVSPDGIFTYVSPNWKELLGHDVSEVEGKSFESFIHPDDLILCRNVLNRTVVSGENQSGIEYRVQHKNGSWQWHTSNASVIRDPEGGIVSLLGIARNITDRKHNERELILLNRAINQSSDAVFLINEQLTFAYVNDAACRSLGYTREELLTMRPSDIDAVITYDAAKEIMSKQFASGSFPRFETRHKTHDGRIFPVEISSSVVEYDGAKFSLTTVRDITERKQAEEALRESEERYRLLVNLSPDAIAIHSQWRIVFVNPAMVRISGAKNESDLIGRPVLDSIHPDFRESVKQRIEKMQSTGESIPFVEEKFLRLDGSAIHVEVAAVPYNYQGVQFVQVVTRDITARKHHEREREAIITVSNALRKATTRGGIFTVILDQLIGLFDADGAMLAMPLPTNNGTFIEAGRGAIGEKFTGLHIPHGEGVSGWVIENRKPYLNNNADQDAIFYRPDMLGDSHCVAAVPLIAQEQAIGALWIACTDSITEQDVLLLNAIADIAANAIHRITLHEQTEQQLHHLTALHQIDIAISSNFDSNVTLNVILNYVKNELVVDAASILLLNPVTHDLDYAAGIGFKTRNIERSHVKFGNEYAGRAAQEYRTVSCPDLRLVHGTFGRSTLLVDEEFAAHYATPLVVKGQVKGVLELFHRKTFEPEAEWISYFETLATQAAIAIENASLLENLQRSNMELMLAYDATIEGWSRALDLRDRETEGHTQRVTDMALKLAEKMGMSEAEKMDLRRGSLLHDIGKMGVPDSILHKPGPLSEDEIKIMRQHPSYAYQMLFPISYLKHALEISYCHHEKWDGSGYPRGLKGEEIPLSARLFAVVDVFDALTSDRPYRKAWPLNDVYRYIKEQSGKHFDPQIVKIFLESRPG